VEQIHRVDKKIIDASTYREIVLSRRSVRHYKDKPVPREIMEEILDLARYSPSAGNDQSVGYIVIQDKQVIRDISSAVFRSIMRIHTLARNRFMKLLLKPFRLIPDRYLRLMDYIREQHESTGRDYVLYDAPALILILAPKKEHFAAGNCSIAATNIMNYAHAMGLGTCCTGFMTMALQKKGKLRYKLSIPKNRDVFASLVMGYPAYMHSNTVSRKKPDIRWER
jgi:nitroreductase